MKLILTASLYSRLANASRTAVKCSSALLLVLFGSSMHGFSEEPRSTEPGDHALVLGNSISTNEMKQAQEALRRKIAELKNTEDFETNVPLTTKLIFPFPDPKDLPPPKTAEEALQRRLDELAVKEKLSQRHQETNNANSARSATSPVFQVTRYEVSGNPRPLTNDFSSLLSKHSGTNVSLDEIAVAASELQDEFRKQAQTPVSVAFSPKEITNGVVTFNLFQAASPQIVVAGKRYVPPIPVDTNPPPKFPVRAYEVTGDTLLSEGTLRAILGQYTGTNIGVAEILKAGSELQLEYRDRGYPTVNVTIPPQQITNGIVKLHVFEGKLASVIVTNRGAVYFSSNNVIRALPSLRTGQVLVGPIFQSELDRANANQDRQIYPQIGPGPRENTSALVLDVRDRLPLHGKVELNNQSSPGTPDQRINASAAYNNLWQLEHSVGVQYSFSHQEYKVGDQWDWYDRPLVANYSAFYRMPLGAPDAISSAVNSGPGGFGYDEATRRFRLPPPSGRPELNVYASRSTIDTGLQTVFSETTDFEGVRTLTRNDVQQDLTVNNNIGTRLTVPMPPQDNWQSAFSFGGDFKTYWTSSLKTNTFTITSVFFESGGLAHTNFDQLISPVPNKPKSLKYLPLSLRYDATERDRFGVTTLGFGIGFNTWYSESVSNLHSISGSTKSSGHWVTFTPSISRDFFIHTNWTLSLRLDGQVANEPLISNEQFGIGGVNSVRGYREGEVFGDDGWHLSIEQKTPARVIGIVGGSEPLAVRGSVFMDYAEAYLLDPQGRDSRIPLWGVGAGAVVSIGTHFDARIILGVPLLSTSSTEAYQPRFNFALTAQY